MLKVNRQEKRLYSKTQPAKLDAAAQFRWSAGVMGAGPVVVALSVLMASGGWVLLLFSIGICLFTVGAAGMYAYSKLLLEFEGQHDTVTIEESEDPREGDESRPMGPGRSKNELLIGPVSATNKQWWLLVEYWRNKSWYMKRDDLVDSGANIKNPNIWYKNWSQWLLESEYISNLSDNPAIPNYQFTTRGLQLLENILDGKAVAA